MRKLLRAIIKFALLTAWIVVLIVLVQVFSFSYDPGQRLLDAERCLFEAQEFDNVRQAYKLKTLEGERTGIDRKVWVIADRGTAEVTMVCIFRKTRLWMIRHPEAGVIFPEDK